jgi:hypothetical protein
VIEPPAGMHIITHGRRMFRALEAFGLKVVEGKPSEPRTLTADGLTNHDDRFYYCEPHGTDVAAMLIFAGKVAGWSWPAAARRFAKHPALYTEFGAAWRLDAPEEVLRRILEDFWNSRRARRKPRALER